MRECDECIRMALLYDNTKPCLQVNSYLAEMALDVGLRPIVDRPVFRPYIGPTGPPAPRRRSPTA